MIFAKNLLFRQEGVDAASENQIRVCCLAGSDAYLHAVECLDLGPCRITGFVGAWSGKVVTAGFQAHCTSAPVFGLSSKKDDSARQILAGGLLDLPRAFEAVHHRATDGLIQQDQRSGRLGK